MSTYLFIGGPAHGQEKAILHGTRAILSGPGVGQRSTYQQQTFICGDDRFEVFALDSLSPEDAGALLSEFLNQRARDAYERLQWKRMVMARVDDDAGETLLMGRKLKDLTDDEARAALLWFASHPHLMQAPPARTNHAR